MAKQYLNVFTSADSVVILNHRDYDREPPPAGTVVDTAARKLFITDSTVDPRLIVATKRLNKTDLIELAQILAAPADTVERQVYSCCLPTNSLLLYNNNKLFAHDFCFGCGSAIGINFPIHFQLDEQKVRKLAEFFAARGMLVA